MNKPLHNEKVETHIHRKQAKLECCYLKKGSLQLGIVMLKLHNLFLVFCLKRLVSISIMTVHHNIIHLINDYYIPIKQTFDFSPIVMSKPIPRGDKNNNYNIINLYRTFQQNYPNVTTAMHFLPGHIM